MAAAGGLPAVQSRPGTATGVVGQGRAGPGRPGGQRAAPLHPGEGASQGAGRRPGAPVPERQPAVRVPCGHVRRLQRATRGRRPHRVLPARRLLAEPPFTMARAGVQQSLQGRKASVECRPATPGLRFSQPSPPGKHNSGQTKPCSEYP